MENFSLQLVCYDENIQFIFPKIKYHVSHHNDTSAYIHLHLCYHWKSSEVMLLF